MGTPDFVIPVLAALQALPDSRVVGVYTSPDRPRGRGRSTEETPVKRYAIAQGLPVFQPTTLRSPEAQQEMAALLPDAVIVAAYGRLLPPPVLQIPAYGCLNLHPSLLPLYRGPSPVVAAIKDGLTKTGITVMLLDEGMDTGPIIAQQKRPIQPTDTAETLTAALFVDGADLLVSVLPDWTAGRITAHPQNDDLATVTGKLERADGQADWRLSATQLERLQRAYTPWPGLFTTWQGMGLKLLKVYALPAPADLPAHPGLVATLSHPDAPAGVVTGDGVLGLQSVQLEGRRPVSAAAFLQGYPSFIGSQL